MVRGAGGVCAFILTALTVFATSHHAVADPDALWRIISQQCVPSEREYGSPKPCELVDTDKGYVVLKDIVGDSQFLVMPTERITGMEDPAILAPTTPNYWQAAWEARHYVDERVHRPLPRDAISLAINSISGRTQNQLHIHVDCVRPDVQAALHEHLANLGASWTQFPVKLSGHDYMAMRIDSPDLNKANPFVLLAEGIPEARADMAHYTLVVAGETNGFVLLAGHAAGITNRGSGEELQDHACTLAH